MSLIFASIFIDVSKLTETFSPEIEFLISFVLTFTSTISGLHPYKKNNKINKKFVFLFLFKK